ncbi:MAG TPA: acyl carrier protein [Bacteroidales bacterium]|nr:acyl carrier protein [Bacteroidales bacterium]
MAKISKNTRNEIQETVYSFFTEECEVDAASLNEKTNILRDLGGDSLMFLELIEIFKKKYSLNIELKTIGKYVVKHPVETIGQLVDMTMLIIEHENNIVNLD